MPSDLDEAELYRVVRYAVRDAIWDVVGTMLTVVLAGVLLVIGVSVAVGSFGADPPGQWLGLAFGLVLAGVAVVYFLREFDLLPLAG